MCNSCHLHVAPARGRRPKRRGEFCVWFDELGAEAAWHAHRGEMRHGDRWGAVPQCRQRGEGWGRGRRRRGAARTRVLTSNGGARLGRGRSITSGSVKVASTIYYAPDIETASSDDFVTLLQTTTTRLVCH